MASVAHLEANKRYAQTEKGKAAQARSGAKYYQKNREKIEGKRLERVYGITMEDYNMLFDAQDGCCALCDTHATELSKRLLVDHCHESGEIRGLLCTRCNSAIAQLGDNEEGMRKALDYMEKANG